MQSGQLQGQQRGVGMKGRPPEHIWNKTSACGKVNAPDAHRALF